MKYTTQEALPRSSSNVLRADGISRTEVTIVSCYDEDLIGVQDPKEIGILCYQERPKLDDQRYYFRGTPEQVIALGKEMVRVAVALRDLEPAFSGEEPI